MKECINCGKEVIELIIGTDLCGDCYVNELRNMEEKSIENKIFENISKEDLISSRQHFQNENIKLSNELYRVKNLIKNRIFEYELIKKELEEREATKSNTITQMNINYELSFLNILIDKVNSK